MHVGRKGGREGRLDGKKVEHQPSVSDSDFIAFSAKKDVDQAFCSIPQLFFETKVIPCKYFDPTYKVFLQCWLHIWRGKIFFETILWFFSIFVSSIACYGSGLSPQSGAVKTPFNTYFLHFLKDRTPKQVP